MQKKTKRDRWKENKAKQVDAIEDTVHVEVEQDGTTVTAESRTSSASSSGSSSFESVQEEEVEDIISSQAKNVDAIKRAERVKNVGATKRFLEDTDHVEDEVILFKPAKKQKTQSVFT